MRRTGRGGRGRERAPLGRRYRSSTIWSRRGEALTRRISPAGPVERQDIENTCRATWETPGSPEHRALTVRLGHVTCPAGDHGGRCRRTKGARGCSRLTAARPAGCPAWSPATERKATRRSKRGRGARCAHPTPRRPTFPITSSGFERSSPPPASTPGSRRSAGTSVTTTESRSRRPPSTATCAGRASSSPSRRSALGRPTCACAPS